MRPTFRPAFRSLAATLVLAVLAGHAAAQPRHHPDRPVKVVVAFAAGGNNDVPTRIVSQRLAELWRTAVNVENRAGAGGIIGTDFVARAQPDGYTLANCNSATHSVAPALHRKLLPYDPVKSFAAVALIGAAPNVLIVPADSPIRSARAFVERATSGTARLEVATAGNGSTQHFSLELIRSMTGADLVHVPYKGGSQALADVIGGQVSAAITGLPTALAAIKAGRVRALAVTAAQRSPHLPDLPTLAESGLPGYEVTTWTGLCAPAGTPRDVVEQLDADVKRALETPEVRQRLLDAGVEPTYLPADALGTRIAQEVTRFGRIALAAGLIGEQ